MVYIALIHVQLHEEGQGRRIRLRGGRDRPRAESDAATFAPGKKAPFGAEAQRAQSV